MEDPFHNRHLLIDHLLRGVDPRGFEIDQTNRVVSIRENVPWLYVAVQNAGIVKLLVERLNNVSERISIMKALRRVRMLSTTEKRWRSACPSHSRRCGLDISFIGKYQCDDVRAVEIALDVAE
jgi:hypothetical protein